MTNPFDWAYLTQVPKSWEAYGPLALAYLGVFTIGLVGSVLLGRVLTRRLRDHALHRRLAERGTQVATWIFGLGLASFVPRALEIPLLGMRLWLYLNVLVVIAAIGFVIWYWRMRYPRELHRYEREQARKHYLRPAQPAKIRRSPATKRRR